MAYDIILKTSDQGFEKTTIVLPGNIYEYSHDSNEDEFVLSQVSAGLEAEFTATPKDGRLFLRWEYTVGETSYESTDNPFYFTGYDENITIKAISNMWRSESTNDTSYDDMHGTHRVYFSPFKLYYFGVTFAKEAFVDFSVKPVSASYPTINTKIYLCSTDQHDLSAGEPITESVLHSSIIEGKTSFRYYVYADRKYYIFIRGYDGSEEGEMEIHISPQVWRLLKRNYTLLKSDINTSCTLSKFLMYSMGMTFEKSGKVKISFQNSTAEICCFWGTEDDYDHQSGDPDHIISGTADGTDDLSIEVDVVKNQKYYLWVRCVSSDIEGKTSVTIKVPEKDIISNWSWTTSNGTASDELTVAAHSALYNKTGTKEFSHLVWNDMVDKVNEMIDAAEKTWAADTLSIADTKMTAESDETKTLTADRFNALVQNVEQLYDTGYSDVGTGDIVYGGYILHIAECLNAWIDEYNEN